MYTHLHHVAVYFFLSGDLSRESLSRDNEQKRNKYARILEELLNKIQATQPIHPQESPEGSPKPPRPFPPEDTSPKPVPTHQPRIPPGPVPDHEPEDYLTFEPAPLNGEEPQEVYEAMADEQEETYEEPSELRVYCACVNMCCLTHFGLILMV